MTETAAIEYAHLRMKDLGITEYYIKPKHLVIAANTTRDLDADNQLFVLVDENADVTIYSDFGFYDLSDPNANELNYEHQGSISIRNNAQNPTHIKFIQAIIKN